jgi:ribosomal protein S18 acetylase RimI-like enzyme
MIFRDATLDDIPQIAAMHIASWQAAYRGLLPDEVLDNLSLEDRCARWRKGMTEHPDRPTLLCMIDDTAAGFLCFGPARDEDVDRNKTAEVIACYVHPDYWEKGIGRLLWDRVRDRLRGTFDEVILWTWRDNTRARGFYERLGFTFDGTEKLADTYGASLIEVRYRRSL